MFTILYITLGLLATYGLLIAYYEQAWQSIPPFHFKPGYHETTKVTVIVPARNEEKNILKCLQSLSSQSYPIALTEVIIVNDHSSDRTEEIVRNFPSDNVTLINLKDFVGNHVINSYKKKAIEVAIQASSGELIITTDADCTAKPDWIRCLVAFQRHKQAVLIAAPVRIQSNKTLLGIFQCLDFITLQGITGASVFRKIHAMCNGANLAYLKEVFFEVGGFKGIDDIASGDDMLLMHKIAARYPDRYFFLKDARVIVETEPTPTWKVFFQQRIRWASKTGKYDDKAIFMVLLMVYLLNILLLLFLLAGIWNFTWFFFFLMLITSKTFIEYSFVRKVAGFFRQQPLMPYFAFLQPLHVLYTIITGWLGKFGNYEWKSRKVK